MKDKHRQGNGEHFAKPDADEESIFGSADAVGQSQQRSDVGLSVWVDG